MKEAAVAEQFPSEYVDQVRAAEAAAQRSVCNIPDGKTPVELEQALERRVEVNLDQADGQTVVRVGSRDPEVRRLEAPYSKRVAADAKAPAPTKPRAARKRTAAKKTAATKAATTKKGTDS